MPHLTLTNCPKQSYYYCYSKARFWSGDNVQNKLVPWTFLYSLFFLFGPRKLSDCLMYDVLQTFSDKNKATFNPGLEGSNPFIALCRNTYWIHPSDSSSLYSYTMPLMGFFFPDQGLMRFCKNIPHLE